MGQARRGKEQGGAGRTAGLGEWGRGHVGGAPRRQCTIIMRPTILFNEPPKASLGVHFILASMHEPFVPSSPPPKCETIKLNAPSVG